MKWVSKERERELDENEIRVDEKNEVNLKRGKTSAKLKFAPREILITHYKVVHLQ